MFPLARFAALRTSALYALLTLSLLVMTGRALMLAVPVLVESDRAERLVQDRAAAMRESLLSEEPGALEETHTRLQAADGQRTIATQRGYAAVVPVIGYFALLLYALSAYGDPKNQSGKEAALVATGFTYGVFQVLAHWATVKSVLVGFWHDMAYLLTSSDQLGAKLGIVGLLAAAALYYDLTPKRRRPAAESTLLQLPAQTNAPEAAQPLPMRHTLMG